MLVVKLDVGQSITGEAGAMTYMSPNINVKTKMREQGILGSLGLSFLGGQSFFVNDFSATGGWDSFQLLWVILKSWLSDPTKAT
jgi:uncharacterized protein (AIM24 family)